MTASPETANLVAAAFCRELGDAVGPEKMAEIVRRNAADGSRDGDMVCHSHDFIDAGDVMEVAMQNILGRDTVYSTDDDDPDDTKTDVALWNAAWGIAKRADFDATRIPAAAP